MSKVFGLIKTHAKTIDEYMIDMRTPIGSQQIIYNLYDEFKRGVPTRRQVGTYLNMNPNYVLTGKNKGIKVYLHSSSSPSSR
jgi:hypothetical protein